MVNLSNCTLETLDEILTPNSFLSINFDAKSKAITRSERISSNKELAQLMFMVSTRIAEIAGEESYLSIEELEGRIAYIDSIHQKISDHIYPPESTLKSVYNAIGLVLFAKGEELSDESRRLLGQKYEEFTEKAKAIYNRWEKELKRGKEVRDIVVKRFTVSDIEMLSKKETFDRAALLCERERGLPYNSEATDWRKVAKRAAASSAVLAFEHGAKEENKKWTGSRRELINSLFGWVVANVKSGEIPYRSTLPLVQILQKKALPLARLSIRFTSAERELSIDPITLLEIEKLAPLYLQNFDEKKEAYLLSTSAMERLLHILEHMEWGTADSLKRCCVKELLDLLDDDYLNRFPSFQNEIIEEINKKVAGVEITILKEGELQLKFKKSTPEGGLLIKNRTICSKAVEVDLKEASGLLEVNETGAFKYFSLIADNLPMVKKVHLPARNISSKRWIKKWNSYGSLAEIALHFSSDSSHERFIAFFSSFSNDPWEKCRAAVSPHNFNHLSKGEIKKLLPLFPKSSSLSLRGIKELRDEDLVELLQGIEPLEELDLAGCKAITDRGLSAIAEGQRELKRLNLRGCSNITENGLSSLLKKLGAKIEMLDLSRCGLGKISACDIAKHCCNLTHIDLSENREFDDSALGILVLNCKKLAYCDISSTSISDQALLALATFDELGLQKILLVECQKVTHEGVGALLAKTVPNIEIDLEGTGVSLEEIAQLRNLYPKARLL